MKILSENGYIAFSGSKLISLTEEGLQVALRINERHRLLIEFFKSIGVSEKTAHDDACKIEHYISDETFGKLKEHYG